MIVTREVKNIIRNIQSDYVFTYRDLNLPAQYSESIIKALNRLAADGIIAKISKGRFYKPKKSVFGTLKPKQEEIIKDLLEKDGEIIGYMTGYAIFNLLGLTTQIPNVVQIGTNVRKNKIQRDMFSISFILQPNPITKDNIPLLQLLDSIKFIKMIPDASVNQSCKRLISLVKELKNNDIDELLTLAVKYPPAVRALLGAIIENIYGAEKALPLKNRLNPLTVYKLGIDRNILPEIQNWRIK